MYQHPYVTAVNKTVVNRAEKLTKIVTKSKENLLWAQNHYIAKS